MLGKTRKGSILTEGVIVLPVWLVLFAGVMKLGEKGVDSLRVKGAERYAAAKEVTRTGAKGPSIPLALAGSLGPERGIAIATGTTRQEKKNSYVMLVCGKARLSFETMPGFFSALFSPPQYASEGWSPTLPENITSSRKKNNYTCFFLARTPRSTLSRRNWDASLIVDRDIWEYADEDQDDDNTYPTGDDEHWDEKLKEGLGNKAKDPKWDDYEIVDVYERNETFRDWSGKALQDEDSEEK